jgi:phosphocarrier protein HPr
VSRRAELVVSNPAGLHARPAGKFGRRGNAKSLVSVLKLGISKDTRISLVASGPDEEAAIAELSALIASLPVKG